MLQLKDLNFFRSIMPPMEAQRMFDEINSAQNSGITKESIGLGNVDNTSDSAKPVSTASQSALDAKAPTANPIFTGTVNGITKSMVGLDNVDNTADASKPVSTAAQTALNLKANLASPTFTGTVVGITKSMVGLSNADNTADASKPVSTAQQTALDAKVATSVTVNGHALTSNVDVTKGDVGLGNVNNIAVSDVGSAATNIEANILNLKKRSITIGGTTVTLVTLD